MKYRTYGEMCSFEGRQTAVSHLRMGLNMLRLKASIDHYSLQIHTEGTTMMQRTHGIQRTLA
jgi:hypothetical protein